MRILRRILRLPPPGGRLHFRIAARRGRVGPLFVGRTCVGSRHGCSGIACHVGEHGPGAGAHAQLIGLTAHRLRVIVTRRGCRRAGLGIVPAGEIVARQAAGQAFRSRLRQVLSGVTVRGLRVAVCPRGSLRRGGIRVQTVPRGPVGLRCLHHGRLLRALPFPERHVLRRSAAGIFRRGTGVRGQPCPIGERIAVRRLSTIRVGDSVVLVPGGCRRRIGRRFARPRWVVGGGLLLRRLR